MNYNDQILENKILKILRQTFNYIVIGVCIILAFALILLYGFHFRPYEVLSDSMAPVFTKGDMVVVKKQKQYHEGDIVKFTLGENTPVTHRIVDIRVNNGTTYYICHGDNVPAPDVKTLTWLQIVGDGTSGHSRDIRFDAVQINKIEGKVVVHFDNWGSYFNFIGEHKLMVIGIIVSLWCFSSTMHNENEINHMRKFA